MTTAEKLMKQGEKKAKTEDARKMLEEGLAVELIVKVTGLSRDEVEKLK
jgi:predicted transposase/invertase (TIGR01784 family)